MRALTIVLLLTLLLAQDVIALPGSVMTAHKVIVRDRTDAQHHRTVREQVDAFNAMLPKRAPRLVYRQFPDKPCESFRKQKMPKHGIDVCLFERGARVGYAIYTPTRHVTSAARVELWRYNDTWAHNVCHEFMHALTGIPDDYSMPQETTSCVHGNLETPGAFDAAYAKRVYKKHWRHRSGPRHATRGKHR